MKISNNFDFNFKALTSNFKVAFKDKKVRPNFLGVRTFQNCPSAGKPIMAPHTHPANHCAKKASFTFW